MRIQGRLRHGLMQNYANVKHVGTQNPTEITLIVNNITH